MVGLCYSLWDSSMTPSSFSWEVVGVLLDKLSGFCLDVAVCEMSPSWREKNTVGNAFTESSPGPFAQGEGDRPPVQSLGTGHKAPGVPVPVQNVMG